MRFNNTVLMYHRVNDYDSFIPEIKSLSVNIDIFKSQIEYLIKKKFNFLTFSDYSELYKLKKLNKRDICLTFDDGWEDNYQFVFPFLKKNNICATFFVVSGYVDSLETLPAWRNFKYPEKHRFMKTDQIREMIEYGMEIGGHTVNHIKLNSENEEVFKKEIIESKKFFEDTFKITVKTFSYPHGIYSDNIIDFLKKCGFKAACIVSHGKEISINNNDCFKIERESISNDSIIKFRIKVSGFHKILRKIK
ncbi:polysaccharide deacetylase family protein [Candidatus Dependentiae bacterium]|nr:polysaccharide deacetylase family protein [Candidatus Dependentiae bacterium]